MTNITTTILDKTAECFTKGRKSFIEGAAGLYKIKQENLWEGVHSSFGEYVEQACGISQGQASKLLASFEHYVLGGVSRETLAEVDNEKLYLLIDAPGTPEEKAEKAKLLSRSDIRAEKQETKPHSHEWIEICKICHSRRYD